MMHLTLPGHIHQPGSVCLRHLGEARTGLDDQPGAQRRADSFVRLAPHNVEQEFADVGFDCG